MADHSPAFAYIKLRYDEGAYTVANLTTLVSRGKITRDEMDEIINAA